MPIYRYECQACEAQEEQLRKASDESTSPCAACGQPQLVKVIAPTARHPGHKLTASTERDVPKSAFEPLTPNREGVWERDKDGHKRRIG